MQSTGSNFWISCRVNNSHVIWKGAKIWVNGEVSTEMYMSKLSANFLKQVSSGRIMKISFVLLSLWLFTVAWMRVKIERNNMKEPSMTSYPYVFMYICWLMNSWIKNLTRRNRFCCRSNSIADLASHRDEYYLFLTITNWFSS